MDRAARLAGLQAEHGVGQLRIGQRRLGGVGVVDRLGAVGAGDGGGVLSLAEPGGDLRGLAGVLGRNLHEGALLGYGQARLPQVEQLLHLGRVGGQSRGQGLGAEAHQSDLAQLGPAQLVGELLHQPVKVGVGRHGRLAGGLGIDHEVVG